MKTVKYLLLTFLFGFIAFFILALLFHPHATPLSNEMVNLIYLPAMIIAFVFVFILPVIILNKVSKKK